MRWGAYTRNQAAVAAAIARKEYTDLTPTGAEVVDEFFALMDQVGILNRLAVEGLYQRRLVPMTLMMTTYCARVILGLSSQNQMPTHLFRDAGLLRRIGYTAKQIEEGFSKRGKGRTHPIHKDTVADALERLTEEESQGIFEGSVEDLLQAKLAEDTIFSMDGMEMHATENYPGAGKIVITKEVKDKWGKVETVTSTRYGYLLLSLRGVESNTVAAARVDKIGESEHSWVLNLVRKAKLAGAKVKVLLVDFHHARADEIAGGSKRLIEHLGVITFKVSNLLVGRFTDLGFGRQVGFSLGDNLSDFILQQRFAPLAIASLGQDGALPVKGGAQEVQMLTGVIVIQDTDRLGKVQAR